MKQTLILIILLLSTCPVWGCDKDDLIDALRLADKHFIRESLVETTLAVYKPIPTQLRERADAMEARETATAEILRVLDSCDNPKNEYHRTEASDGSVVVDHELWKAIST